MNECKRWSKWWSKWWSKISPLRGTPLCIFLRPQEIKIIKTRRVRRHEESDCSEESQLLRRVTF